MDRKKLILQFIKKHKLTVISTVGADKKPESAVIGFGQTDRLELIFKTLVVSRKYKNLKNSKWTSFVIGWDENITVQYVGKATELKGDELEGYKQLFLRKNPKAKKWEGREGIVYFKVTPTWIRYSDLNKDPWEIFEIREF